MYVKCSAWSMTISGSKVQSSAPVIWAGLGCGMNGAYAFIISLFSKYTIMKK